MVDQKDRKRGDVALVAGWILLACQGLVIIGNLCRDATGRHPVHAIARLGPVLIAGRMAGFAIGYSLFPMAALALSLYSWRIRNNKSARPLCVGAVTVLAVSIVVALALFSKIYHLH
jgi:hypothetical protein